jgi:hypothetical protein
VIVRNFKTQLTPKPLRRILAEMAIPMNVQDRTLTTAASESRYSSRFKTMQAPDADITMSQKAVAETRSILYRRNE